MKQWVGTALLATLGSLYGQLHAPDREEPTPIKFEGMAYPVGARAAHIQGVVVIRLKLDGSGVVISAIPLSGPIALRQDAIANSMKWRFKPGSQQEPILVYRFKFGEGLCGFPCPSQFIYHPPNFVEIKVADVPIH